jgi:subfamily B ATP-binding cassette protein MsbA
MKNFVRLVQFAWRYRVRFGLSIGCAAMVALLFFTELGAVYPLLHILFDSQNPKKWVSQKITSIENEIVVLDARALEVH